MTSSPTSTTYPEHARRNDGVGVPVPNSLILISDRTSQQHTASFHINLRTCSQLNNSDNLCSESVTRGDLRGGAQRTREPALEHPLKRRHNSLAGSQLGNAVRRWC